MITQEAIAQRLGLSRRSVMRALNGQGKVSEATRRRVLECAREGGYALAANGLLPAGRTQTGNIGFLWVERVELTSLYFLHIQDGLRHAAQGAGHQVLLLGSQGLSGWEKVDGVIVHATSSIEALQQLALPVPFVALIEAHEGVSCVLADNFDGARQAAGHLLSLGHTRIGYLIDSTSPSCRDRLAGYRAALAEAGIAPGQGWERALLPVGGMDRRGLLSMHEWLTDGWNELGLTGLLVQNDRAAIGAMAALREAGLRVPADVSVVGFDSTDECELSHPRLTSVRVPLEQIGKRAVERLLAQIENAQLDPLTPEVLPVALEVRGSTAAPRGENLKQEPPASAGNHTFFGRRTL